MKKLFFTILSLLALQTVFGQVWFTKTGAISFFSQTDVEDIQAKNNEAVSFLDATKGEFRFQVLIKGFRFPKAAMEGHFNQENYMDSEKFPKADFKGVLLNPAAVDFKKDGTYNVELKGTMTMHGVSKEIKVKGTITIKGGVPGSNAKFIVNRSDYGISVPSFSDSKISQNIEVTVVCVYEPYKS